MLPLSAAEIRGNWATLLLPLNADESIDFELLAAELDHFVTARVDGVYSNGTAGEFYAQSEEEFDRVSQLLAAKCEAAGLPFQIGASHVSPQLTRERVRRARSLRPGAFQIILPDWFAPSWPETLVFLETVAAEASPVPLVIYNPPHAKRRLAPEEWQELVERIPGIVGIKVAGGDETWFRVMTSVIHRISVFIPGHLFATGLAHGAHGAYSNVACLSPAGAQRWANLCRSDPPLGLAWQEKIVAFWREQIAALILHDGLSNMAADKAAAVAGGWLPGLSARLRWPYRGASPERVRAIAAAARTSLPEGFHQGSSFRA